MTDTITNFSALQLTWAARNSCTQRAGRTGRVMNGRCYRFVENNFYYVSIRCKCLLCHTEIDIEMINFSFTQYEKGVNITIYYHFLIHGAWHLYESIEIKMVELLCKFNSQ